MGKAAYVVGFEKAGDVKRAIWLRCNHTLFRDDAPDQRSRGDVE